jgi:hypothetical protein
MKVIDKFILHVVHNLFPLNEYSDKEVKFLMDKFKEEAEDLNIQVNDEQLKKYIERFDRLKDSPKVTDKDLRKYSLSKLIKLVTASPGAELPSDEKEDDTPDVVYHEDDIIIWNGAKQGNCITYGANQPMQGGSRWCITQPGGSYFGTYRYGERYDYPTFYLAKNNALSDNDRLSFVAIQVLKGGEYKFTNRANNPGMEGPFSWEELNRRIPWLSSIPNLKNILKYIPFSKSEKESEVFKNNPINIKQWIKEPFNVKKQYLIIRAGNSQLFSDISNDLFISKYLPQYPQIATTIAGTSGIINIPTLLKYLDKFSKQDQVSIAKQIREKFDIGELESDLSFDLKKYLTKTNKFELKPGQRLYVTKDNQAIVLLTLGNNVKVGVYTEEDDYPNIKLNKRTSKYLLDYPELDKIPLRNLLKLIQDEVIDNSLVTKILDNAKKDPNSAIAVKSVEDGDVILDSNTFSSYKIGNDGKISSIPFDNEEVQQILDDSKDNEGFQQNALNLFKTDYDIPAEIDKNALFNIIKSIPYNKRTIQIGNNDPAIILTSTYPSVPFFLMRATPDRPNEYLSSLRSYNENGDLIRYSNVLSTDDVMVSYLTYLRQINKSFNDNDLLNILKSQGINSQIKKTFIRNNPPVAADNRYKAVMRDDDLYLINIANPRESSMLSTSRNNLKQANISPALANQLLGIQPAAEPAVANPQGDQARRRGRPPGQANAPQAAAAPAAAGNINVPEEMDNIGLNTAFMRLPRGDYRKLAVTNAERVNPIGDRGAARRNNILGNNGSVGRIIKVGASKIYIIRLANQQIVAFINIQPGNRNYLLTGNANGNIAISLNSPDELLQALQRRNLAEIHQYIVNEYFNRNPEHLSEFRQLLRKHLNEKKKQNEQK